MKVEFLQRGEFVLTTPSGKVKGKVCTWSLKQYSEKRGIDLKETLTSLIGEVDLRYIITLLHSSIQYYYAKENKDCPYSEVDVSDWIDEAGGIDSFGSGWYSNLLANAFPVPEENEKKNTVKLTGTTSSVHVIEPVLNQPSTTTVH